METKPTNHFLWRKLHSLFGVIPLGLFLFIHLFINSFALKGPGAFDKAAGAMVKLPYLIIIELIFIFIPLLFHMIYGLAIIWSTDPDLARYPKTGNFLYFTQRATGIVTIIFIFAHVYSTTFSLRYVNHQEVSYQFMSFLLANPVTLIFYVIGLASAVFHFANGIWNFMITWGITAGRDSQRAMGWICLLLGIGVFFVGLNALAAFLGYGITIFNG
ncbi:succinate dehydrogenase [bacterium]|nr:succinate dehydrogenase [bacterium]